MRFRFDHGNAESRDFLNEAVNGSRVGRSRRDENGRTIERQLSQSEEDKLILRMQALSKEE